MYQVTVEPSCTVKTEEVKRIVGDREDVKAVDCSRGGDIGNPYCRVIIWGVNGARFEGSHHKSHTTAAAIAVAKMPATVVAG